MPSDDLAGDEERRVPIPEEEGNAQHLGMPSDDLAGDEERRVLIPEEEGNAQHLGMPSDIEKRSSP